MKKYPHHPNLDLLTITQQVTQYWKEDNTFLKSQQKNKKKTQRHFYEGPPGANGKPGIHHLFSRTLKDLFCRYATMCGYKVPRKAGWDTHGLPVELTVEASLGITKEDIGKTITIEAYNATCKKAVMHYLKDWNTITERIGYWVDLQNPYITYQPHYISALWGLIKQLHKKNYLYKGHSIQPYSPAAGTGLSTHELNQPGCYKEVKDTTIVAQFSLVEQPNTHLLAWTTTPWTLPANTALAINPKVTYVKIKTYNPYTHQPIQIILAQEAIPRYLNPQQQNQPMVPPTKPATPPPWKIITTYKGSQLLGQRYHQLMPYIQPSQPAFKIIAGDFVTTTEGTGIVHIAPTFGSDDHRIAQKENIPPITVQDKNGNPQPIVDKQGKFVEAITDFAHQYVKPAYNPNPATNPKKNVDIQIAIKLKKENKAFHVASYLHSYPHCWRTDKPILYYPLDAWFIKTTACKERLITLNKTINWQPKSTGAGRFGDWLKNIVDWNITRDRFWGTPLPIWRTKDKKEEKCIGSLAELRQEVKKSILAGHMTTPLPTDFDPHRPYVDHIILVSKQGQKMYREPDVIDVWFDSGGMPYAQHNTTEKPNNKLPNNFPAHFIIEGIDQTRGWFFTLHALAVMLHDKVAFKNVLSTGLVLDKKGQKMSKRLGNVIEPNKILDQYGPDVLRWYMVVNANPWENMKFDPKALQEIQRKFFGTLHNSYQFFALYANIDQFDPTKTNLDPTLLTQSDQWILSKLQGLIQLTTNNYEKYSPTQVARAIQQFVINHMSNWYVRLNRRRFWQAGHNKDKQAAYQTLYSLLTTIARLAAPIAPFYTEWLHQSLTSHQEKKSVHLTSYPKPTQHHINPTLEKAMEAAQTISSLVHSLRKKHNIKVRQPLAKILIPIQTAEQKTTINQVAPLILAEVNVKEIQYIQNTKKMLHKKVRPNYQQIGKQYGPHLNQIKSTLSKLSQEKIIHLEQTQKITLTLPDQTITLTPKDLLITTEDIPGWAVAQHNTLTVALDLTLTPTLISEGIARELINRIQNHRKEQKLAIEDKITLHITTPSQAISQAINQHRSHIMKEIQAKQLHLVKKQENPKQFTLGKSTVQITITKIST